MIVVSSHTSRKNQLDDNMIPLINIVFLMLIFFMIAGQISSSELLKIQPPTSEQRLALEEHDAILLVSEDGKLAFNNQWIKSDTLTESLQQSITESKDVQAFKLLVKTDAILPANELMDLLQQVRAAGILKVSLATQTKTKRHD
ncbi:ExbD/TolR family protein [Methylophaga pinxianii]|uniref:ExbD/TolR family protein n=1 Tax=Methylophaga pinxianii TaxID=2881052 RepID=UPI001CF2F3BE|nr:biopolymer transporter ExbD [Methylophaga pinxianii]MCB2427381.1 biopolymer transporter ExbD [Methylophaga pinxianii]UPH45212.1 biopolymer transporter ExbD [Methylophaga pinxianii]